MFVLLLSLVCAVQIYDVYSTYTISVYGDTFKDKEFFTRTYPWIVDNIGGELSVEYYMQGSGRHTVPQMCALVQLEDNTFLQAQYLKCEAEDRPSEICLCEAGVNPWYFRDCVRQNGQYAATSASMLQQVGVDVTPLIELGPKSTIFGVDDTWYLKKICSIFGDYHIPSGCTKPFSCNGTDEIKAGGAIAQFDTSCPLYSTPTHASTRRALPDPERNWSREQLWDRK